MSIAAVSHRYELKRFSKSFDQVERFVFGLKGDVKDNIHYLDEHNILYPAGSNTVIYNIESKTQRFIPITEKCEGITAMAVSSNKRNLAIGERGEKTMCVIYDLHSLRRRKILIPPESEARVRFVSGQYRDFGDFLMLGICIA
jgi:hypothetical protein